MKKTFSKQLQFSDYNDGFDSDVGWVILWISPLGRLARYIIHKERGRSINDAIELVLVDTESLGTDRFCIYIIDFVTKSESWFTRLQLVKFHELLNSGREPWVKQDEATTKKEFNSCMGVVFKNCINAPTERDREEVLQAAKLTAEYGIEVPERDRVGGIVELVKNKYKWNDITLRYEKKEGYCINDHNFICDYHEKHGKYINGKLRCVEGTCPRRYVEEEFSEYNFEVGM